MKHTVTITHTTNNDLRKLCTFIGTSYIDFTDEKSCCFSFKDKVNVSYSRSLYNLDEENSVSCILFGLSYINQKIETKFLDKYDITFETFIDDSRVISITELGDDPYPVYFKTILVSFNELIVMKLLLEKCREWYLEKIKRNINKERDHINIFTTKSTGYFKKTSKFIKRNIDTIHIPVKKKKEIVSVLDKFLNPDTEKLHAELGIPHKLVIVMEGPPGTGKTSLIKALASKYNKDLAAYVYSKKFTDTELLDCLVERPKNCFLVLEDAGWLVSKTETGSDKDGITISCVLNLLDGLTTPLKNDDPLVIFLTTNNFKLIEEEAMIRPGRVDYLLRLDKIEKPEIKSMFKMFMKDKYSEELASRFVLEMKKLKLKISPSYLQQHFYKYFCKPEEAIENLEEILELQKKLLSDKPESLYS